MITTAWSHTHVHRFCFWFDVLFVGSADTAVRLSTGPEEKETHWKQALFYINDPIQVRQDDVICGSVSITPNGESPRYIDTRITFYIDKADQQHQAQQRVPEQARSKLWTMK